MTDRMKELGFERVADVRELKIDPFTAIGTDWVLISAGNEKSSNTMTASWGFMGIMWGKPAVEVFIRKSRYTKEFVDKDELFTISLYPSEMKKALSFCGSKSGRDFSTNEKAKAAGLTAMSVDGSIAYEEAELIFVCRKIYQSPITDEGFVDKSIITAQYSDGDYHTAYIAEIVAVYKKK